MQYVSNGLRTLAFVGAAALASAVHRQTEKPIVETNAYINGNTICEELVPRSYDQFTGMCDTTYADGLKIRRNFLGGLPFLRAVISPEGETLHQFDASTGTKRLMLKPEFDAVLGEVVKPEYCALGRCKEKK